MTERDRLDDLMQTYIAGAERGDHAVLSRLIAANPALEHQLTAFAVQYALLNAPPSAYEADRIEALTGAAMRGRALAAAFGREHVAAIEGIMALAAAKGLTISGLTAAVDLPRDILAKLDRRLIEAASVPRRVLARLAETLETTSEALRIYFDGAAPVRAASFSHAPAPPKLGEQETFAHALGVSNLATAEQRELWRQTLLDEGLA